MVDFEEVFKRVIPEFKKEYEIWWEEAFIHALVSYLSENFKVFTTVNQFVENKAFQEELLKRVKSALTDE